MAKRRYRIIRCDYEQDLVREVADAIHQGWEPLGGVVFDTTYLSSGVQDISARSTSPDDILPMKYNIGYHWRTQYVQTLWLPPKKKTSWWRK
jgi:hypothetical protein